MAASPRITAQNIIFKIGSTDYSCDANMIELALQDAPGDVQTFCEQRVGGQWTLQLDGVTSNDDASLYRVLWTNFGTTAAFTIVGSSTATPGTDNPTYSGTVKFDQLPPLSLMSNETVKFSVTLTVANGTHNPASGVYYGVTLDTTA
jgi:hypothetical protein